MAGQQLRALVGARVSVLTGPQKVSNIAQLETATKWAESKGYEIVGRFEDLGVSASVRPDERPDVGQWLTDEGASKWDVIVWSKMDRAFRSTRHCVDFAQWAEERHKILVFAEDNMTLNYRDKNQFGSLESMMSELFIYLGSFFAQLELNRFKSRAKDSHRVLKGMDRWASGVPPLGFRTVPHPSGKGRGLATDPEGKELLQGMASRLLDGWSFIRIAAWLNESGALTNMDKARMAKGKEPYHNPWNVGTVIESLTSPRTQGLKMTKQGKRFTTVLDAQGEPIRMAPPTFDNDTWKQIQEAAALRKQNRRTPTGSKNPMLGVGFCAVCGASLAQQFSRRKLADGTPVTYRTYRCGRTPVNCKGVSVRADVGDGVLEESFLEHWGNSNVVRRVFVPGEDHTHELDEVNQTIARLRKESDAGLVVSDEDERIYLERMRALIDRRTKLEDMPARSAGWVTEETDQTYAEAWAEGDHRQLLVDAGFRLELGTTSTARIKRPWFMDGPDEADYVEYDLR
jgi:site-specific DNA recombinase